MDPRVGKDPMYSVRVSTAHECNPSMRVILQIVLAHSQHPPIMKGTSWTLAAPFKEEKYHRTPSESIANNFTPTASGLKIKNLPKRKSQSSPRGKCGTDLLFGSVKICIEHLFVNAIIRIL